MGPVVVVEKLTKKFKKVTAVEDLSFSVMKGEIYGFLGQNGAGKSTTIRMLLTLVKPTSGTIMIFDKDIRYRRKEILFNTGGIIEKPDLYKFLTAKENLKIIGRLSGKRLMENELMSRLAIVGIADRADSRVHTFSEGMKQRLAIACALAHDPELIILDEPTNGLDPQGIADIRKLIIKLSREDGKTIILSSHLLSEIEMIADSMLIIDKGKKLIEGSVSTLLNPANTIVELETSDDVETAKLLQMSQWQEYFIKDAKTILFRMHRKLIPQLVKFLVEKNVSVSSLKQRHSLEDYFLSLTSIHSHDSAYKD